MSEARKNEQEMRHRIVKLLGVSHLHLQRFVSTRLKAKVCFQQVLAWGKFNIVIKAVVGERVVALRLPYRQRNYASTRSGWAAGYFCSTIGIPAVLHQPVKTKCWGLPFFSVMELIDDAIPVAQIWGTCSINVKKTTLADLADLYAKLYHHPFSFCGGITMSGKGDIRVGTWNSAVIRKALGLNKTGGVVHGGPYTTWLEYIKDHIRALQIIHAGWVSIVSNLELVLKHLDKVTPPFTGSKFYLRHPDFHAANVLVDPSSGHVKCVLDWDSANVEPLQALALYPGQCFPPSDADKNELKQFYLQELRSRGAGELADEVDSGSAATYAGYEHYHYFYEVIEEPRTLDSRLFELHLYEFCELLLDVVDEGDEVVPMSGMLEDIPLSQLQSRPKVVIRKKFAVKR